MTCEKTQQINQQLAPQSKPCQNYHDNIQAHISNHQPNHLLEMGKMYNPPFILRKNSPCWHPIPDFEALLSIASRTGWIHPYSSPRFRKRGSWFKLELGIPINICFINMLVSICFYHLYLYNRNSNNKTLINIFPSTPILSPHWWGNISAGNILNQHE